MIGRSTGVCNNTILYFFKGAQGSLAITSVRNAMCNPFRLLVRRNRTRWEQCSCPCFTPDGSKAMAARDASVTTKCQSLGSEPRNKQIRVQKNIQPTNEETSTETNKQIQKQAVRTEPANTLHKKGASHKFVCNGLCSALRNHKGGPAPPQVIVQRFLGDSGNARRMAHAWFTNVVRRCMGAQQSNTIIA